MCFRCWRSGRQVPLINTDVWAIFSGGRINNAEMAEKCLKKEFCWVNFALVRKKKEMQSRIGHAGDGRLQDSMHTAPEAEQMNTKEGKTARGRQGHRRTQDRKRKHAFLCDGPRREAQARKEIGTENWGAWWLSR